MQVVYHEGFIPSYTYDPAAETGRIEAIVDAISTEHEFIDAEPASESIIAAAHTSAHIEDVKREGLFEIAALAAGAAVQTARIGLREPAFGIIRPPGHHASADSAWGFCYFNNMAIALLTLKKEERIQRAIVLDIDLHFGDGTVNILGSEAWVDIENPASRTREGYIREVETVLSSAAYDVIGISAGFDHHIDDWGGLLATEDYTTIGQMVRGAAQKNQGGCFAILEGGYNHKVLGHNVAALLEGLSTT